MAAAQGDAGDSARVAAQVRLLKAMRDRGVLDMGCARMVSDPGSADHLNAMAAIVESLPRPTAEGSS